MQVGAALAASTRVRAPVLACAGTSCPPSPPPSLPLPPLTLLQNDLEFFRLRTKSSREILAAPGNNSLVIVVQVWRSTTEAAAAAAAQASAEAEGKVGGGH